MTVSVVVPTWRRSSLLQRCIDALRNQTTQPDEVLIVGRAEDTESRLVVQSARETGVPGIRWIEVDKPGHVAPILRGVKAARGEIVAWLDDDAEPSPSWLGSILEPFADRHVGCVGGRVVTPGSVGIVKRDAGQLRWYGQFIGNVGSRKDSGSVLVDAVMEGNCAWRATVLASITFDPKLDFDDASMYGLDLCLQARSLGFQIVYQPAAIVTHHGGPRSPELDRSNRPRRTAAYSRNFTYIALKHLRGTRRAAFVLWWWLVGERGSYGLFLVPVDVLSGRRDVLALARAAFEGKWEGIRVWRRQSRP